MSCLILEASKHGVVSLIFIWWWRPIFIEQFDFCATFNLFLVYQSPWRRSRHVKNHLRSRRLTCRHCVEVVTGRLNVVAYRHEFHSGRSRIFAVSGQYCLVPLHRKLVQKKTGNDRNDIFVEKLALNNLRAHCLQRGVNSEGTPGVRDVVVICSWA